MAYSTSTGSMQTVVELDSFVKQAAKLLLESEVTDLITTLASNPEVGAVIKGTGGFRKLRLAREGRGKSGGYRVVYFFANQALPIFLVTVYAKNERENLTQAEKNSLYKLSQHLKNTYGGYQ